MSEFPEYWRSNVSDADLTSMRTGGVVDFHARPHTVEQVQESLRLAKAHGVRVKILGGGSNLILADTGFRGVLIQPLMREKEILDRPIKHEIVRVAGRYTAQAGEGYLQLGEAPVVSGDAVLVRMSAGIAWGEAVMWSLRNNLAGLHEFARIPCRVGGAVYNNIHAKERLLSELVYEVQAVPLDGATVHTYKSADLDFRYDYSRFHHQPEVITSVVFQLKRVTGEVAQELQDTYLAWTKEKARIQPAGFNCGSVFQNLSTEQAEKAGESMVAAGWYIDQLGLRGYRVGGMQVFPGHANFIVNVENGTQADFIYLVKFIREKVFERWGVWLLPEAECMTEFGETVKW